MVVVVEDYWFGDVFVGDGVVESLGDGVVIFVIGVEDVCLGVYY